MKNKIIKTWNFMYNPCLYESGTFPQGIDRDINDFIYDKSTSHSTDETGDKYTYDYEKGFKLIDIKYSTSPCKYRDFIGESVDGIIEAALLIYEVDRI